MQFPDPRKLDFWLWVAVFLLVIGSGLVLWATRPDRSAEDATTAPPIEESALSVPGSG